MNRVEDWPERLDEYIKNVQRLPFHYGLHDCCTMAADWVRKATGNDPMASWRGEYRTATGARRMMHAAGGLEAMVTSKLGEPIPAALAQRGDVVLADMSLGPTMGIVLGVNAAFPGLDGVEFRLIPLDAKVWRI